MCSYISLWTWSHAVSVLSSLLDLKIITEDLLLILQWYRNMYSGISYCKLCQNYILHFNVLFQYPFLLSYTRDIEKILVCIFLAILIFCCYPSNKKSLLYNYYKKNLYGVAIGSIGIFFKDLRCENLWLTCMFHYPDLVHF